MCTFGEGDDVVLALNMSSFLLRMTNPMVFIMQAPITHVKLDTATTEQVITINRSTHDSSKRDSKLKIMDKFSNGRWMSSKSGGVR